jgi:hypothetical protein
MSSTRAARVIAALGASGVLAASGLVLAGPAHADAPVVTPTATYTCSVSGFGSGDVPVAFSIPAAAFGASIPVGTKVPAIPVSAQANVPGSLLAAVVEGLAIVGSSTTYSSLPVPSALSGSIGGDSTVGSQNVLTSLGVATPLTSLLTNLAQELAAQNIPAPKTLGDLSAIASKIGLPNLVSAVEQAAPSGLDLTSGSSASGVTGTVTSFTASKVGKQTFSLPSKISADLLSGVLPAAPCTFASGTENVGSITVVKDASSIASAKLSGTKLTVTVANGSKTSLKPTGSVTAYLGSKKVGSGSLKKGVASFALKGLKHGSNKLTVKYAGSKLFNAAKPKTVTVAGK